jgi:ergothioneine biosynthesis protein EgtB
MPDLATTALPPSATWRRADAAALARIASDLRAQTLTLFDAVEAVLGPSLEIAYAQTVNPPLWEIGHVGWFEEFWIARNTERRRGAAARLEAARAAPLLPGADALYDSSNVAHTRRWHLDLPDAQRTRRYLREVRERSLALLGSDGDSDAALYFFRLCLAHEAMHHEADLMIAQGQGWPVGSAAPATGPAAGPPRRELTVSGGTLELGADEGGFVFDNERGVHLVELDDFAIDSSPVTWREMLPFFDERGTATAHVQRDDAYEHGWRRFVFGQWGPLNLDEPAVHVSGDEARAWCEWAGRRLPTEEEWVWAQRQCGDAFAWGEVWEWTASPFAPWPGFEPHPYRDYSAPWFDGRPVLKGGSFATQPWMKHPHYRNFFFPWRSDVFSGFRSVRVASS